MDRSKLDRWCRWAVTGLLLLMLVWAMATSGAMRPQDFLVVQGLAVLAGIVWIARMWISREPRVLISPLAWPVLAFAVYAMGRYYTSELEYVARFEVIKVLVYVLVFFLSINHLQRHRRANAVILSLIFICTAEAGYAFYQYIAKYDMVWHFVRPAQYAGRGSGTWICPNHMAGFLEMLLPLALAYIFWGKLKPLKRIFLVYATAWLLVGIFVSLSRGGWVATALSMAVFGLALLFQPRFRLWAIAGLCIVVAGITLVEMKTGQIRKRLLTEEAPETRAEELVVRRMMWQSAFNLWKDQPVWGVGPGHYDHRFRTYRPDRLQGRPDRVHNDYLNVLVDWGIVGALPLGLIIVMFFRRSYAYWAARIGHSDEDSRERSARYVIIVGGTIGVLTILLHTFVDFHFHVPSNALLAVVLVAMVTGQEDSTHVESRLKFRTMGRVVMTCLLLPLCALLVWQGWRGFAEWRWLDRGKNEKKSVVKQIDAYKKAFELEPNNFATAKQIGNIYWMWSKQGYGNWREPGTNALPWFTRAAKLNPYDSEIPTHHGMCLDWLGRHDEAWPYYKRALELDPHSVYVLGRVGWHFMMVRDYVEAQKYLEEAFKRKWTDPFVRSYLLLARERAADKEIHP